MYVPPLQPVQTTDCYHVGGDVAIHPSAIIAPGAMLQADAEASITIGPGACIGMGAMLHALNGAIEIAAGASVGAGVLIVGQSRVGANACIGAVSTLWNASVAAGQLVSPGSVLEGENVMKSGPAPASPPPPQAAASASVSTADGRVVAEAQTANFEVTEDASGDPPINESGERVIGRVQLNRLMVSLFPQGSPVQPAPDTIPPVSTDD